MEMRAKLREEECAEKSRDTDPYFKTFMVFNFTIKILTLDTFPLLSHSTYSPIFWLHTYLPCLALCGSTFTLLPSFTQS